MMSRRCTAESEIRLFHFCSIRILENGAFKSFRILYRQNEIW